MLLNKTADAALKLQISFRLVIQLNDLRFVLKFIFEKLLEGLNLKNMSVRALFIVNQWRTAVHLPLLRISSHLIPASNGS
jgi:hypothetical protein